MIFLNIIFRWVSFYQCTLDISVKDMYSKELLTKKFMMKSFNSDDDACKYINVNYAQNKRFEWIYKNEDLKIDKHTAIFKYVGVDNGKKRNSNN